MKVMNLLFLPYSTTIYCLLPFDNLLLLFVFCIVFVAFAFCRLPLYVLLFAFRCLLLFVLLFVIFVSSSNFEAEAGSEWVVGTCVKSHCVAAGNNELISVYR